MKYQVNTFKLIYMKRCQIISSFQDRMLFGQYKGRSIKKLPRHYLKWMWENNYIKCTKAFFKSFKKKVLSYGPKVVYLRDYAQAI